MGTPVIHALARFGNASRALRDELDAGAVAHTTYRAFREALYALEIAATTTRDPGRLREVEASRNTAMRLIREHVAQDRMDQLQLEQQRTDKAWGKSAHTLAERDD